MAKALRFPKREEFLRAVNAEDPLSMIVRTHKCLDAALVVTISERLTAPHGMELEEVKFPLKVDLAIALGGMSADLRPVAMQINRLRNGVAHKHGFEFDRAKARALFQCLSPDARQRVLTKSFDQFSDHAKVFREVAALLYVHLGTHLANLRDQRVRDAFLIEEMKSVISMEPHAVAEREKFGKIRDGRMDALLEEDRKRRRESGEP